MHTIAVSTYGSHRVSHPITKQKVSAYKLGYTGAARAALLALLPSDAHDVTSRRASYHYVQITPNVPIYRGWLLFRVTDAERDAVAAATTREHRADVYLWRDSAWLAFPDSDHPDYHTNGGPSFDPSGHRTYTPSTGEKTSGAQGIIVERSQLDPDKLPWWWLSGDTYPYRETLKRWGCRWSRRRKAWYVIGAALPDAVQALVDRVNAEVESAADEPVSEDAHDPCSVEEAAVLGTQVKPTVPATKPPEPEPEPPSDGGVRVRTPVTSEREDLEAVVSSYTPSASDETMSTSGPLATTYCGELTGAITGFVYCYGAAIHDETLLYLNMGGPRSSVEAIRAKLSKGQAVSLIPPDGPGIELSPGTDARGDAVTGAYTDYTTRISEAKFQHTILVHELAIDPNYGGASTTFFFRTDPAQGRAKLREHVFALVGIPVFRDWERYLWDAGKAAMLVRSPRVYGGADLVLVDLDRTAWERLITGGVEAGHIALPA